MDVSEGSEMFVKSTLSLKMSPPAVVKLGAEKVSKLLP